MGRSASSSTRSRFTRRQWSRRWAAWRLVVAGVLLAGLLAGGGWLVFFSSTLAVESVRVDGVRMLTGTQVQTAADVPRGEPLARVDLDEIRARVERVPAVKRADVRRTWPRTISITVTERSPVAVVKDGGRLHLIDAEGVLFRRAGNAAAARLPVISTPADGGRRAVDEAAAVLAAVPPDLTSRVRRVEAGTMDSITLLLRGGRRVVWGSAQDSALKAEVLSVLLDKQRGRVYDVSVPGSPTVAVE